ncbi:hypothetical protein BGX28_004049 [Mortierella sp. GBA30]|nr:hypothetical protein BGX28_004049 [Mortierella sp. GBA30]
MLQSISTSLKDKLALARSGLERVQTTTTVEAFDPQTSTITTITSTESLSETRADEHDLDRAVSNLALTSDKNDVDEPSPGTGDKTIEEAKAPSENYNHGVRRGIKRILENFTRKEDTTAMTLHEQPDGVTVDTKEGTSMVSFTVNSSAIDSAPSSSASSVASYPSTINARFVKDQSRQQSLDGLRHALKASIEKSSAANESGRLFEGGILTSANHKRWYHTTLPINWIQKMSSEHHFGNYVISNRKTGTMTWEDMPIYARIGMHLLFACMLDHKLIKTHRIQHLFSAGSVKQGRQFDAPESVAQIAHFIKTYKLDLSELLQPDLSQYKSFNEFFYRKLRPDARPVFDIDNPNIIVSSADCRLCVFKSISAATQVWVKGKSFSVENLVQDKALAEQFDGGSIALFRLAPQDYHRFHSPVSGHIAKEPVKVDGTYLTVNPMAVNENLDVFTENVRKITVIDLEQGDENRNENFDQAIFVSIGALLVGSIVLTGANEPGGKILKGDELGYFAYGGSTCILLFKAGAVQFDEDLVATSLKGVETLVRMGERIGARI